MRRGVGEAGVDVEVEVELEGDIVPVMVGGELSGRRRDLEERNLGKVIDPLRMLSCVLCKKSGRSYVMHGLRNWFRWLLKLLNALPRNTKVPTAM